MIKTYSLLFIDDEQRVLRSLKSIFRRDYKVFIAASGQEALDLLATQSIDVVVCDQRMPSMTGDQVLTKIHESWPEIIKIILTGFVDSQIVSQLKESVNLYRCISKPWSEAEIIQAIDSAVLQLEPPVEMTALEVVGGKDAQPKSEPAKQGFVMEVMSPVAESASEELNAVADASSQEQVSVSAEATAVAEPEQTMPVVQRASAAPVHSLPKKYSSEPTERVEKSFEGDVELGRKAMRKLAQGMSVLLFEQDQIARNQIRAMGKSLGVNVYSVSSNLQAAKTITLKPDIGVAILGVTADEAEILDTIDVLKEHRRDLVVLALSSMGNAHIAVELVNRGYAFRYLDKPLTSPEFVRGLASGAKRHGMLKEMQNLADNSGKSSKQNKSSSKPKNDDRQSALERLRALLNKSA